MTALSETLKTLETAEDFLDHFAVPYDQHVVDVYRLHILQRLHDRLAAIDLGGIDDAALFATVAARLAEAYRDFARSDLPGEKTFRVFRRAGRMGPRAGTTVVPLAEIRGAQPPHDA